MAFVCINRVYDRFHTVVCVRVRVRVVSGRVRTGLKALEVRSRPMFVDSFVQKIYIHITLV